MHQCSAHCDRRFWSLPCCCDLQESSPRNVISDIQPLMKSMLLGKCFPYFIFLRLMQLFITLSTPREEIFWENLTVQINLNAMIVNVVLIHHTCLISYKMLYWHQKYQCKQIAPTCMPACESRRQVHRRRTWPWRWPCHRGCPPLCASTWHCSQRSARLSQIELKDIFY